MAQTPARSNQNAGNQLRQGARVKHTYTPDADEKDKEGEAFEVSPAQRLKQFLRMRARNGRVDWKAVARARQHAMKLHREALSKAAQGPVQNPAQSAQNEGVFGALAILPIGSGPGLPSTLPPSGWKWIGPNNLTQSGIVFNAQGYRGSGPGNLTGRVSAAAFDPNQAQTLYVAGDGGGIWKSVNAGQSWTSLTEDPTQSALSTLTFSSIAVDPFNSKHLLAGSGDYDYTHSLGLPVLDDAVGNNGILGSGLFESNDGGLTWHVVANAQTGTHVIRRILFDPKNQGRVLIGLGRDVDVVQIAAYSVGDPGPSPNGGVLLSTDDGQNWQDVLDVAGYVSNIVYDMNNQNLYASADFAGVFMSTNNGLTWSGPLGNVAVAGPPPVDNGTGLDTARVDVAASQVDPSIIYVLSENDLTLYTVQTPDNGQTWIAQDTTNSLPLASEGGRQGWYDFYLACSKATTYNGDPGQEPPPDVVTNDVLYVGLLDIFQSPDGGSSWNTITFTYSGNDAIHTDQHAFAVNPHDPNDFLAGNDGGIYRGRFRPNRGIVSWQNLNSNLHIYELYNVSSYAVSPTNHVLIANLQDNGSPQVEGDLTDPTALSWTPAFGGDGMQSWINPTNYHQQLTSTPDGNFIQTDDSWTTWTGGAGTPAIWVPPLAQSANTEFLFSGGLSFAVYDDKATFYPQKIGAWKLGPDVTTDPVKDPSDTDAESDVVTAVGASPLPLGAGAYVGYAGTQEGLLWAIPVSGGAGGAGTEIDDQNDIANPFRLPPLPISAIQGSGVAPFRVFVGLGAMGAGFPHLYRCDDFTVGTPQFFPIDGSGGDGFHVLPDAPINSLVVLPHDDEQVIYAATDVGLFYTTDGGLNWNSAVVIPGTPAYTANPGSSGQTRSDALNNTPGTIISYTLPNVPVSKVIYNPSISALDVATYGRGVFRANLGASQPIQILPRIPGYAGGKSKLNATLDLFHAGQVVEEEPGAAVYDGISPNDLAAAAPYKYFTPPVETRKISLTPAGYVKLPVASVGAFDIYLTVDHCIRKNVAGVNTKKKAVTTTTLILGDVDGDNAIDGSDLNQILLAIQSGVVYTKSALDVNGDGKVDIRDYNLVRAVLLRYGGFVQGD